eukprot:5561338-Prymnesium_polylepis.1
MRGRVPGWGELRAAMSCIARCIACDELHCTVHHVPHRTSADNSGIWAGRPDSTTHKGDARCDATYQGSARCPHHPRSPTLPKAERATPPPPIHSAQS